MTHRTAITAALLLTCVSAGACAAPQSPQVETIQIDAAATRVDPRLEKTVSIDSRSVPLKALLDNMAKQTGVELHIDERDPASGYTVFVVCDKVQVGKLMGAVYGLFSIRRGEWAWTRIAKAGTLSYTLHETPWAKDRDAVYRKILDGMLANYVQVIRELAPMSMEERKRHREELKMALFTKDDAEVQTYFEEPLFWSEANLFLTALTPEQQSDVLHGSVVTVAMSSLSPEAHAYYREAFKDRVISLTYANGTSAPAPDPETISFAPAGPNRSQDRLAPAIFIGLKLLSMSWMGTGSLEFGLRDAIKRAWILQGDTASDPAGKTIVAEPRETDSIRQDKTKAAETLKQFQDRYSVGMPEKLRERTLKSLTNGLGCGTRLEQVALGSSIPILAVLPPSDPHMYETPVGKSVQQFLDHFANKSQDHFYKWRDGVLLFTYPYWFTDPVTAISYSILGRLHPDKSGHASLRDWTSFMSQISDDQAGWFAANYNVADTKAVRACLLVIAREQGVLQKDGAIIDDDAVAFLKRESVLSNGVGNQGSSVRIRIIVPGTAAPERPVTSLQVDAYTPENDKWVPGKVIIIPALTTPWPPVSHRN